MAQPTSQGLRLQKSRWPVWLSEYGLIPRRGIGGVLDRVSPLCATGRGWALCDIVLGLGKGPSPLPSCSIARVHSKASTIPLEVQGAHVVPC